MAWPKELIDKIAVMAKLTGAVERVIDRTRGILVLLSEKKQIYSCRDLL
jgi:hypothetical protein